MTPAITATAPRTLSVCVPCVTGQTHTRHDADTAAVAERATIRATPNRNPVALYPQLRRVLLALPSTDLAALARDAHRAQCLGCKNELCPIGLALETATRPDRSWCPDPNGTPS